MELSDAYEPPKNKPLPPSKPSKMSTMTRRIIGWGISLLVIGILVGMLLPVTRRGVRPAARRVACMNNMRQLVLAMHNYEASNGHFPPAYIADDDGSPMHSWRVLILPFLDQQDLFERYSMDEPWDGPNNRLLADEISSVFECYSHSRQEHEKNYTNYCLVTGKGTLFEADETRDFGEIKDGSSNTVILVEVNHGDIQWMEPRDLTVDEAVNVFERASSDDQVNHHAGIQNVTFADGSTQSLSATSTRDELLKLFLIADETSNQK